ncbi:hypothetical protein ACQPZ2_11120 [Nocardia pseudovaccinii]|uniref:hypothetical protein n=2 Tax=Nocardia pseudovaccinii TaxID=189540 RepID=UPI003D8AD893
MSTSGKSLEQRVCELELWRDHQITRDTVTVTQIHEQLAAIHASMGDIRTSIGDLDGRSVASRLISMNVDMGNMASRQDVMDVRLASIESDVGTLKSDVGTLKSDVGTLKSDVGTLKSDVGTLKSDVGTLKSDVGTLKSDVAQILQILRKPDDDN